MPSYYLHTPPFKTALFALAAMAGLTFTGPVVRAATEEIWNSPISANWSNNAAWLDGSAPNIGGAIDLTLRFIPASPQPLTATNDLGSVFQLNQLLLDNAGLGLLTVASAPLGSIQLAGTNPAIRSGGLSFATVSSPIVLNPADGNVVTLSATNTGGFNLSGSISETGGSRTLVVKGNAPSINTQTISLGGQSSFSGGVTLESGNLGVFGATALGTGPLTIKGGNVRFTQVSIANPIILHSDLFIQSPGFTTLSGAISSAVPGTGLLMRNSGSSLTLTGASTYTGSTTLDYSLAAARAYGAPGTITGGTGALLRLSGNGSLLTSSGFFINEGQLQLDGPTTGAPNRIGDNTAVNLRSGQLSLTGVSGALAQGETIGALSGAGFSVVAADRNIASLPVQLTAAALNRVERGTFLFRGSSLGGSGAARSSVFFTTAPAGLVGGNGATGSQSISILPYAVGDTSPLIAPFISGTSFVTYSATGGIRPLATAEYATSLGSGAQNNVRTIGAILNSADVTLNALVFESGSISGTGTLTITSGAVLQKNGTSISNSISFGTAEANLFAFSDVRFGGVLSGTNGLTKSGPGKLTLGANNNLTGLLTINAGLIGFGSLANLGGESSAVILNGTGAGLSYAGTDPLTLSRNLEIRTGIARLEAAGGGDLTVSGTIVGPGGIRINSNATRTVVLTGANTFTGPTLLAGGSLLIDSDASLGNGGPIDFAGGKLAINGPWTTSREISIQPGSPNSIDTGAHTATLNGLLTGSGALTKNGTGSLRIRGEQSYSGLLTLNAGSLELSATGTLALPDSFIVNKGATLLLDNSEVSTPGRISPSATITLNAGRLALLGNATVPVSETAGALVLNPGGNILTLTAPGTASTTLRINSIAYNDGELLLRSTNLGALSRLLMPAGFTTPGIISRVYADDDLSGSGKSFVVYDSSGDASGTIGFRPLRASEMVSGNVIPANGLPAGAHFLTTGAATAAGTINSVGTLTLDAGSGLALGNGQILLISTGNLLARAGATSITGGTLDFGAGGGTFYNSADFQIGSAIGGKGELIKTGPGMLTFNGVAAFKGGLTVANGRVRFGAENAFAAQTVTLARDTVLELNTGANSIGGLAGAGEVVLGSGTLTAGGNGSDFTFSGIVSGTGSLVIVDGGNSNATRTLLGVNTFSGNLFLNGGRLVINNSSALGTATLTANGGSLQAGAPLTLTSRLVLNNDLLLRGPNTLTFGSGTQISGPGAIAVSGAGGIAVQTALTTTGAWRSAPSGTFEFIPAPGAITIGGALGSVATPAGFRIENGSLIIDNATPFAGPAGGRIGDSTPVELRGGGLWLKGNTLGSTTETIGVLSSAGHSNVALVTPGFKTQLTVAALNRIDRGTFSFDNSDRLGVPPNEQFGNNIFIFTPPAGLVGGGGSGPDTSIIPYAISNGDLVTYDPVTGIRPLESGLYSNDLFAGALKNIALGSTSQTVNNTAVTLNALVMEFGGSITGSGTLKIGSGVISTRSSSVNPVSTISNGLVFNSIEAQLFVQANAMLKLNGVVQGSGGMTVSGAGTVQLNAANTFTGQITINGASLSFDSAANLGNGTLPIFLNGGALRSSGSGTLSLSRDLVINSGFGIIGNAFTAPNAIFNVPTHISGPGGLDIEGDGYVVLFGANSYEGPTRIGGRAAISSDAAFGTGSLIQFFNSLYATIQLNGPWTTTKNLELYTSGTINTNGFDATVSGQIRRPSASSGTALIKAGTGVLTLSGSSPSDAALTINGGTLSLPGSLRSSKIVVSNESMLVLDNGSVQIGDRLPDNAAVTLSNGNLRMLGNAGADSSESLGILSNDLRTHSTLTLTAPGSFGTRLGFASLASSATQILFRGDNLGGAPGGAYSRIFFAVKPALVGNIIAGAVADNTSTGNGISFATYDSGIDATGPIGVRPLRPEEYFSNQVIQSASNGGNTPAGANFLVKSATTLAGTTGALNTLTVAEGGSVTLGESQLLTLSKAGIFTPATVNATLNGGRISGPANLLGDGNLTLNSKLIDVPALLKAGTGTLTVNGQIQSPLIDMTLGEGTLRTGAGNPLLNAKLTVGPAGTLDLNGNSTRIVNLSGHGNVLLGAGTLTTGAGDFLGSISGTGGLAVTSPTWLILRGSNPFSGPTQILGGAIVLTGNGKLAATSSLSISNNGYIQLDDTVSAFDRLGAIPVSLNQGSIELFGNFTDPFTQNLGPLSVRGASTISVSAADNRKATELHFASLTRLDRGTLDLRGDAYGFFSPLLGGPLAKLTFDPTLAGKLTGAGTSAFNRAILPFALCTSPIAGFVTYDALKGVRSLDAATEYSPTLSAGDNVRLSSFAINNEVVQVNSLLLLAPLTGTGTIGVSSGAVLSTNSPVQVDNALKFDNVEAVISSVANLTLAGPLSGSNGLTKSGAGTLILAGSNNITGPLVINQGTLQVPDMAHLGAEISPIVLNDAVLRINAAGGSTVELSRPISLNGTRGTIDSGAGLLRVTTPISGEGGLNIAGNVVFEAINTYTGSTYVSSRLTISSDAVLGASPSILLSGTLALSGPWITERAVQTVSSSTIDTGEMNAVLRGSLSGLEDLSKRGTGRLTVSDAGNFFGGLYIVAGTFDAAGFMHPRSVAVSKGATLTGNGPVIAPIMSNGVIAPGHGIGILSTGALELYDFPTLAIEIGSANNFDQLQVTGAVYLSGPVTLSLALAPDFYPAPYIDSFPILLNDGTDAITLDNSARFTIGGITLNEGTRFTVDGRDFSFSYTGGTGNDAVIYSVPEPATLILFGALSLVLLCPRELRKARY